MSKDNASPVRLVFNALGCAAFAAISLTVALTMAFALTAMDPPRPDDPDGPKALGLVVVGVVLGALFGIAGIIDLLRTVKKIRALPEGTFDEH